MIFTNLEFNFSSRQSYIIFLPSVDSTAIEEHIIFCIGWIPSGTESSIRTTCYCVGMLNWDKTIHSDFVECISSILHSSLEGESTVTIVGIGSVSAISEQVSSANCSPEVTFSFSRVNTKSFSYTRIQRNSNGFLIPLTLKNEVLSHFRNCGILYSHNGSCWSWNWDDSVSTASDFRSGVILFQSTNRLNIITHFNLLISSSHRSQTERLDHITTISSICHPYCCIFISSAITTIYKSCYITTNDIFISRLSACASSSSFSTCEHLHFNELRSHNITCFLALISDSLNSSSFCQLKWSGVLCACVGRLCAIQSVVNLSPFCSFHRNCSFFYEVVVTSD